LGRPKVLVVDDEKLIRWSVAEELSAEGYEMLTAASGEEALEIVAAEDPDLVVLDLRLPGVDGLTVLGRLRAEDPSRAVVILTASDRLESVVAAMKLGAYDYLQKPFEPEKIRITAKNALETASLRREVGDFRQWQAAGFTRACVVAESAAMRQVLAVAERVGRSEATTALIDGESGTGKNVVARLIHGVSQRAHRPLLEIKCTSLPETLAESELFGHERGAFTGANALKKGLLELADRGTLVLDEMGDMSPHLQAKLLGFIEEKRFKRVGGTKDVAVDVRIVASTNRDLRQLVREGRFREDLFFRLNVVHLRIPPLRDRRDDVLPLARSFIAHFNKEFRRSVRTIAPAASQLLLGYRWPGNARELRNVIEHAMILHDGDELGPDALSPEIARTAVPGDVPFRLPEEGVVLDEVERLLLRQALDRAAGNQVRAARLLGLTRHTLRYRLHKHGLA
jgi:two-component system, NtrC family, response regulator AtoC